jgi:antitoxin ParD1/3/4
MWKLSAEDTWLKMHSHYSHAKKPLPRQSRILPLLSIPSIFLHSNIFLSGFGRILVATRSRFHFHLSITIKLILMHIWCNFTPKNKAMARQSISFSKPNDEWLKSQIENEEYSSKSELVNDLVRQARKQQATIDWLRAKLEKSEMDGFTTYSKEMILKESKSKLNG